MLAGLHSPCGARVRLQGWEYCVAGPIRCAAQMLNKPLKVILSLEPCKLAEALTDRMLIIYLAWLHGAATPLMRRPASVKVLTGAPRTCMGFGDCTRRSIAAPCRAPRCAAVGRLAIDLLPVRVRSVAVQT